MKPHVRKTLLDYGCRLAWLRESAKMPSSELAERAGLDVNIVEQIERGELSATLEQLRMIAGALRVSLSHLFDVTEPDDAPESLQHALIVANVMRVLGNLAADTSCLVLPPGVAVAVSLPSGLAWPDAVVVRESAEPSEPSWLIREPLVIVEVVTDSSELADRGGKFQRYLKLESLVDYVIVSTRVVHIEHYTRSDQDEWRLRDSGKGARVQLQAIAGQFAVDDVYRGVPLARA